MNTVKKVKYDNKYYGIMDMGKNIKPLLLDWNDMKYITKLHKNWKCHKNMLVSCTHTYDGNTKEINIHDIVMALKHKDEGTDRENVHIAHLNRNGLDNRRDNLIYDKQDKVDNKNIKKKKRTIVLPSDSGIDPDEIPTYVWYLKPNGTHGDRFSVEIDDIKWKTTSSSKVSLRYKLEEAKQFLREVKEEYPQLFDEYSMNGEMTIKGKKLMISYNKIIEESGFKPFNVKLNNITDKYIAKKGLRLKLDRELLQKETQLYNPNNNSNKKRRLISNLPKDSNIEIEDLPKYSYYRPAYENKGDCFIVENHPNQEKKIWQTTSSKKISIDKKFQQLLEYMKTL